MFTDGSRLEEGAAGYAVAWKNGQSWDGIKTHMGFNQEAYDAECAALARALGTAAKANPTPECITIFTDAQAAIRRMNTDDPGPGQKYALESRQHIAELRGRRPSITIEIRWCPAHEGVEGNELVDRWAKLAADEPDTPGVEWLEGVQPLPLPTLSRQHQAGDRREEVGRGATVGGRPDLQEEVQDAEKPEAGRHGCGEHQAACCKVLPAEDGALPHRRIPALDEIARDSPVLVVPVPQADEGPPFEEVPEMEGGAEDLVGGGIQGDGQGEVAVESARAVRREWVQPSGAGLPLLDRRREDSAGCGNRRRGE